MISSLLMLSFTAFMGCAIAVPVMDQAKQPQMSIDVQPVSYTSHVDNLQYQQYYSTNITLLKRTSSNTDFYYDLNINEQTKTPYFNEHYDELYSYSISSSYWGDLSDGYDYQGFMMGGPALQSDNYNTTLLRFYFSSNCPIKRIEFATKPSYSVFYYDVVAASKTDVGPIGHEGVYRNAYCLLESSQMGYVSGGVITSNQARSKFNEFAIALDYSSISSYDIEIHLLGELTSIAQTQAFYDEGYQNGFTDGTTNGYSSGYNNGYNVGYAEGLALAQQGGFTSLFGAIADTPVMFMRSMFNFDLFGMNVFIIIMSLLTGIVVIYVIKKVIH